MCVCLHQIYIKLHKKLLNTITFYLHYQLSIYLPSFLTTALRRLGTDSTEIRRVFCGMLSHFLTKNFFSCKYKVNNNSYSACKRSTLVMYNVLYYCSVDGALTTSLQIKSWNLGTDFEGGYRCASRYTVFMWHIVSESMTFVYKASATFVYC